ncbi:MAG: hypothetical protein WC307_01510 [Candidatus Nanoarchaeia archaeon]|jgi:uncharacterized protein (UPF0333 family)
MNKLLLILAILIVVIVVTLLLLVMSRESNDLCSFILNDNSLSSTVKQNRAITCYYENYTKRADNNLSVCDEIRADYRGACYGNVAYNMDDINICDLLDGTIRIKASNGLELSNVDECVELFNAKKIFS